MSGEFGGWVGARLTDPHGSPEARRWPNRNWDGMKMSEINSPLIRWALQNSRTLKRKAQFGLTGRQRIPSFPNLRHTGMSAV